MATRLRAPATTAVRRRHPPATAAPTAPTRCTRSTSRRSPAGSASPARSGGSDGKQMRLNSSHAAADQRREGYRGGEKDTSRRWFGTGRGFSSIYQDMFVCVCWRGFGPVVSQHWMVSVFRRINRPRFICSRAAARLRCTRSCLFGPRIHGSKTLVGAA